MKEMKECSSVLILKHTHTVSWKPGAKENATLCAATGRPCSVRSSVHETPVITLHQWEYCFSQTHHIQEVIVFVCFTGQIKRVCRNLKKHICSEEEESNRRFWRENAGWYAQALQSQKAQPQIYSTNTMPVQNGHTYCFISAISTILKQQYSIKSMQ